MNDRLIPINLAFGSERGELLLSLDYVIRDAANRDFVRVGAFGREGDGHASAIFHDGTNELSFGSDDGIVEAERNENDILFYVDQFFLDVQNHLLRLVDVRFPGRRRRE